jgi:hypothetical protein
MERIATLEFVVPSSWLGGARNVNLYGRPAPDFQMAFETASSNLPSATYSAWHVGLAVKSGWSF